MVSGSSNVVDVNADLKHETAGAFLICTEDGKDLWVPKSLSEYDEEEKVITVPMWFAQKEGLI